MNACNLISNYLMKGNFTTEFPIDGSFTNNSIDSLSTAVTIINGSDSTLLKSLLFIEYIEGKLSKEELCDKILEIIVPVCHIYDSGSKYDTRFIFELFLNKNDQCIYDAISEMLDISVMLNERVDNYTSKLSLEDYDNLTEKVFRTAQGLVKSIDFKDYTNLPTAMGYCVFYDNFDKYASVSYVHDSADREQVRNSFKGNLLSSIRYYLNIEEYAEAVFKSLHIKDLSKICKMLEEYDREDENGKVNYSGSHNIISIMRKVYEDRSK